MRHRIPVPAFQLASLAVLAFGLVACSSGGGSSDKTPSASVTAATSDISLTAKDFSYTGPDSVVGGMVKITMANQGAEPHQAQLVKLNPGVTTQQFLAAAAQPDPSAAFALVTFTGGPNTIDKGQEQTVYDNLTAGNYLFLCFVSGDDNIPHFAKGMVKQLQVAQPSQAETSPPQTAGSVTLADFSFNGVDSLKSGKTTLEVKNAGPQVHELSVLKLNNGVTADQVKQELAAVATPPSASGTPAVNGTAVPAGTSPAGTVTVPAGGAATPAVTGTIGPDDIEDAGGLGAQTTGGTGYVQLDLAAGNYVFLCFIPDQATGLPHASLGMVKGITVK